MRSKSTAISLGRNVWEIRPLTLRQIGDIEPILVNQPEGNMATMLSIISVALDRDFKDRDVDLWELEATASDVRIAFTKVLRIGGFIPAEDGASGESEAQEGAE